MANYSDTYIKFTGPKANEALEMIKSFTKDDWLDVTEFMPDDSIESRAGFSYMDISSITDIDDGFEISASGRWCSPFKFIEIVAKKFDLSGSYLDREAGCDFTHVMKFDNGTKVTDVEDCYFSQLAFDYVDIESMMEDRALMIDEENWEEVYKEDIELFAKNGVSLSDLKERWGVQ